ncbi:MAG TPA: hypothetical protein VFE74_06880 [Ramlibacter sp.]|nr:hypothetical protein [Ramlibacter sp.]
MTRTTRWIATVTLAATLTACGGGGDDSGQDTAWASGAWAGATTSGRDATALVLADGSYALLYSAENDPATLGGAVQGTGTFDGSTFTSTSALDFNVGGTPPVSPVPATFSAKAGLTRLTLDGTVTPTTGAAMDFRLRHDAGFNGTPSLATLAGVYTGNAAFALGIRPATFTVTAAGDVSSSINACAITGKATPREDGNVYDLTIQFGPLPCALPGASFTGMAYLKEATGALQAVAQHAATGQTVIFAGSR